MLNPVRVLKSGFLYYLINHSQPSTKGLMMICCEDETTSLLLVQLFQPCKYAWWINYMKMLHKLQFAINQNIIGHIKFG